MIVERSFLSEALPDAIFRVNDFYGLDQIPAFHGEGFELTFSLDSRTIKSGEIFVAIKGSVVDGALFAQDALTRGAVALLCEKNSIDFIYKHAGALLNGRLVIGVDDCTQAIEKLAYAWRSQLRGTMIAITGSVGKTTTKELVGSMLRAAHKKAFISFKNQNNNLGLALNLLSMQRDHPLGVFEVGTSSKGEILARAQLLRPSIAVITAIAHAHTQGIGSLAEIAQEKLSLFSVLQSTDRGIICGDQPLLDKAYYHHPVARFGKKIKNQVQARRISFDYDKGSGKVLLRFILRLYNQEAELLLPIAHEGFLMNVLAAATVGVFLDLSFENILAGISLYRPLEDRWQELALVDKKGTVISDCYNANPESMRAALRAFDQIKSSGRKIAILGDMFELGEKEAYWHRQLGRYLCSVEKIDAVLLVGERIQAARATIPHALSCFSALSWQEALDKLSSLLVDDVENIILVKGSRGMQLEKLVKKLCNNYHRK